MGEDLEAEGERGEVQSWTERDAKMTAKVAWIIETIRLQNSKDLFGKTLLITKNPVVHDTTPNTTNLII